jgi:excisionase family DNA binding protein
MTQFQAEIVAVLDNPELDATDKLEAIQRTLSCYHHCTPAENAAIIEEMFGGASMPAKPKAAGTGEWLTSRAACKYAKCSRQTLWRWKQEGLPSGRNGRVRRSDLDAWLNGGDMPQSEDASKENVWLTIAEAAARAGTSRSTIERWGNNGLKMKRHGRIVRILSSVLEDYLKRRR